MSGQLDNFWACADLIPGGFHSPFFMASPTDPTLAGLTPHGAPKITPSGRFGIQMVQKETQMGDKIEARALPKPSFHWKLPTLSWTYYLLYILHIHPLPNCHFLHPWAIKNASENGHAPVVLPMASTSHPSGSQFVLVRLPMPQNGPCGLQLASQNPLKILSKSISCARLWKGHQN